MSSALGFKCGGKNLKKNRSWLVVKTYEMDANMPKPL